ncbi:unnamed protein product [Caenorhabditis bovis]|uniref:4'-phosphopantetheine phosphatase n=1 Tax=Caenorhabditis bovis TaxID=2654633 RepID=A0A8S1EEU0_9PELO|nr:unnamed protein product [Caenorhabditis bovis]
MSNDLGEIVRNATFIKRIFFDIGSKTIKIAYISTMPTYKTTRNKNVCLTGKNLDRLHCIQVNYENFSEVLDFLAENAPLAGKPAYYAFTSRVVAVEDLIKEKLKVELICTDVFECIVKGTSFLLKNIEAEAYTYSFKQDKEYEFKTFHELSIYPYIIVNIRTGVSIMRVNGPNCFKRIGGSSIGGGSFLGLASLLTGEENLEKLMEMAELGDASEYDKLISDVYGDKVNNLGLPGHLLAASFAKAASVQPEPIENMTDESKANAASSLLRMITYNVAQMAFLYAEKEKVDRVFFNGFLVRNRPIVMKTLSYSFNYWSSGKLRAFFLRHENYTSVIGAFLTSVSLSNEKRIREREFLYWKEHYSGSTALGRFVPTGPLTAGFNAQTFEMDCAEFQVAPFVLIDNPDYIPDTIDFNKDVEARDFWLNVMSENIQEISRIAFDSQVNFENRQDLIDRVEGYEIIFKNMLDTIREHPFAYGNANARNILEFREQILREYGFDDIYLLRKHDENNFAATQLRFLNRVIDQMRKIKPKKETVLFICRCLLAGNVFDWGAKEVVKLMNRTEGFSFQEAIEKVQERPWLIDNFDEFYERYSYYQSVMVFVDNSGCDYVLGVIPFIKLFMRNGAKVIIVANTTPALNDITYSEMNNVFMSICATDDELRQYSKNRQLHFAQSGQGSPCLDLRKIHSDLNRMAIREQTDLVVLEGMGRAIHTNFKARFRCDVLKAAVIKTKWLAGRLGGDMFSIVFKWERGTQTANNVKVFFEADEYLEDKEKEEEGTA